MRKFLKFSIYSIFLIIYISSQICLAHTYTAIKKITIEGLERVEEDTVRNYINISEGESITDKIIDESLKKLYKTGLFSKIDIEQIGPNLIIKLIENPIINQIAFEGNKSIKSDDIRNELLLKPRAVYTKVKLQNDLSKITALYNKSGRFSVNINPTIIKLPQNRINLVFEIKEGKKTLVKKILFVGNKNFKDNKLSSIINTKEYRWYQFFTNSDRYDAYKLEHDKELLRRFYNSKGFADFKIISANADLVKDKDEFVITFSFEEGNIYKFGKIDIENNISKQAIDLEKLKSEILTKENDIYNYDEVEDSIDALTKYLNDTGIPFVNIEPVFDQDEKAKIINIKYIIEEGKKLYLNKINIHGNIKTVDKVIRREFRLAEGDPYNASQISRSEQRIRNLDYFSKIELSNVETKYPDKYDIDVDLTEKSTSKINIGGGYSGADGVLGQFSFNEENFLGHGQEIVFRVMKGSKKLDLDFSFTEPYLFDKNLSAGFDLYRLSNDKKNINPYKSLTNGVTLRTAYDLNEYLTHLQRYSLKQDKITEIDNEASIYIKEQRGSYLTSSIGHTLFYDKVDSRVNPTKGYSIKFDQEFAGLGGKAKFIRNELNARYYKPFIKKDFILQFMGNIGHIAGISNKEVRINERFFVGDVGSYGLRGFAPGGIGPRAFDPKQTKGRGDPLGGNIYYTATASLSFPLGLPEELDISGSLFTDMGSLYKVDFKKQANGQMKEKIMQDKSLRLSVGAGLVWITKMGPIRLDFPMPLLYKKYDRKQYFHINFSTNF